MKVLVLSDSHGWTSEVETIIARHKGDVDLIFHCGDSELSSTSPVLRDVLTVKGNCDFGVDFPEQIVEEINGIRFFVTHGHLLDVKKTATDLISKAKENKANIACFGHTHVPVAIKKEDVILINPGSIRHPKRYSVGTYVIMEALNNLVKVTFYNADGQEEKSLNKVFS